MRDSTLFRVTNAPALAIILNFAITDWLLLPGHSLLLVVCFIAHEISLMTVAGKVEPRNVANVLFLAAGMHFTQWILCYTQQTFRARSILSLEDYKRRALAVHELKESRIE